MDRRKRRENLKRLGIQIGIGASKAILMALLVGAAVVAPGGVAGTLKVLNDLFEGKDEPDYTSAQMRKALYYLRSRKLIDIGRQYQKDVFALTKLGRRRAAKLIKSFGIKKPKSWDGKWRMVVFDIPVEKRDRAETFRQQLKNLGLANVQKSIWVHPYDCREQIYYLAGNLFIKPYVRYVVAQEITGEDDLRRRFAI